jgi:hypothetical protein
MNESELNVVLERAISRLFERQPNIFEFTSETGQTEWNLAHHLAVELRELFPSLDHDLDVVKWNYENKRPDIIFHKRGTHEANHLVIEIKRDGNPREIDADIDKVRTYWFRPPLRYEFGAIINLRTDGKHEIQILKNAT